MKPGPFSILRYEATDAQTFVDFWSAQYHYPKDHLYDENIGKPITPESLSALFEWKNGSILSAKKQKSIQQYLPLSERIEADASTDALRKFLCRSGGAIWRIFWLHLQHPHRFPIYDQHVHRAMARLSGWPSLAIATRHPRKVDAYLDQYLPFVASLGSFPIRKLDRALWAFGRFLSLKYQPLTEQAAGSLERERA
jgi:hypothetical protein